VKSLPHPFHRRALWGLGWGDLTTEVTETRRSLVEGEVARKAAEGLEEVEGDFGSGNF